MAPMKRWKRIALGSALALLATAAVGLHFTIGWRNLIGMLRYDQRREGALKVGDAAPSATLERIDGTAFELREAIGQRPLVLIFGNFT